MDSDLKTFNYNGINIRYRDVGSGKPMIFLHGFGASSRIWNKIYEFFSRSYRVFLIDLKGFGLSDRSLDNKYSINDQAEIILNFIEKNSLNDIILIGHSFGGAISLSICSELSKKEHSLINRLILIDSPIYKQELPSFIKLLTIPFLKNLILAISPSRMKAKIIFKKCFFDIKKMTPEIINKFAETLKTPGSNYVLMKTAEKLSEENKKEEKDYRKIKIPIFLIWGREDKIIPLEIGEKFAKEMQNSKLEIISECGHIPMEEKPEKTIKIISEFLNKS